MSGIVGWLGRARPVDPLSVHARLAHRGLRMQVAQDSGGCTLLQVADEAAAMTASRGDVTLILDGRIYAIGGAQAEGMQSDAAWLLDLYLERGPQGFDFVNGDYAVAIWDGRSRQLLLGRDFCGAQPLYFTALPDGTLFFASEYKALLLSPECDASLDMEMIQRLQSRKHLLSERTLFSAIRSVPPGTLMAFSAIGRPAEAMRISQPSGAVQYEEMDEAARRISESFLSAMRVRVQRGGRGSSERIGVALSGGIDSIGVAFACRKFRSDAELHTFTAGVSADDPEVRTAELVSQRLGAIHHPVYVTPQSVAERLPEVVWHLENPISRSESVQFFELGRAARGVVDVLISGVAADGLYAGMPRHKILWLYSLAPPLRTALLEFYSLTQAGRLPRTLAGRLLDYLNFKGKVPPVPAVAGAAPDDALPGLPPVSREFLNGFLRQGFQESVAQWLPKLERTLGASGVGFTSPYLDRGMIETAFTVPAAFKIRRGKEKFILRRALRSLVSPELLAIPKFPMRMTYDEVFADHMDALADRYLSRERVRARGLFDPDAIEGLRCYRRNGVYHAEAAMRLWSSIVTEIWAETFIDRRGSRPEPVGA